MDHDPSLRAQPPRVLVVDPNSRNLSVMSRRLSDAGYRVAAADSGSSAIAELHRAPVDLIVAELYMPRISGADLTRLVRDEVLWRHMPIMLITSRSKPEGAVKAYEAGADDVILKPFHFEVLFARIERRLARVRSLQAVCEDNAALDARIVARAIELGELRDRLQEIESDRRRLQELVARSEA